MVITARIHPGETPAQFIMQGMLDFLCSPTDPRAAALRDRLVFQVVPMLNPDGVYHGHYRADTRGVNLNRVYAAPSAELHPPCYAIGALVREHPQELSAAACTTPARCCTAPRPAGTLR